MLKRYGITAGAVVESQETSSIIEVFLNPDAEEREYLVKTLKVDEHTLGSALDPDEMSRLEFEEDHVAIIFKRPKSYSSEDELLFKISSIGFFIFKEKLVVVTSEDYPIFAGKQFQKTAGLLELVFRVIDRTIVHYFEHLKVINQISSSIEEKLNASMENKYLFNLFTLEKSLVYYLDAINGNEVVIERIKNSSSKLGLTPEWVEYMDDIIIENRQCYKLAEIYSDILSSLMDARASIVNNNLSILIKRLTIINIVFLPLNLLASIGGMSEYTMMTVKVGTALSYSLFLAGVTVIGLVTYILMSKLGLAGEKVRHRKPRKRRR